MKKSLLFSALGVFVLAIAFWLTNSRTPSDSQSGKIGPEKGEGRVLESLEGKQSRAQAKSKTDRDGAASYEDILASFEGGPTKEMTRIMNQSYIGRNKGKADRLVASLVEELNLSPRQAAELKEFYEKQLAVIGDLLDGKMETESLDGTGSSELTLAFSVLEGKGLNDTMLALLDEDQQTLWKEREEKRVHRSADSGALKQLASLGSSIEIRDEQRDEIYEHFYQKQVAQDNVDVPENSAVTAINGMTESLGIDLGLERLVNMDYSALAEGTTGDDGKIDPVKLFQKQKELHVNAQVEELEPFLDSNQLDEYRNHLQSQESFLDGLINNGALESLNLPN